jgi:hypothetical protein
MAMDAIATRPEVEALLVTPLAIVLEVRARGAACFCVLGAGAPWAPETEAQC